MVHARTDYDRFQEPKLRQDNLVQFLAEIKELSGTTGHDRIADKIDKFITENTVWVNGTPIGEDEPVFLLRAKDHFFGIMVEHYQHQILAEHPDSEQANEIDRILEAHRFRAEEWQKANGCSAPTVPLD